MKATGSLLPVASSLRGANGSGPFGPAR